MPSPESKTEDTTQFARVSDANGDSPLGAASANDGLAPLCDAHGRLIAVIYSGSIISGAQSIVDSGAATQWQLIKASAGKLYQAWGNNTSGVQLWALLFDVAAGPPAGVPAFAAIPVPNNGAFSYVFPEGLDFANGILVALSTGPFAYAAPPAGSGWISALFR